MIRPYVFALLAAGALGACHRGAHFEQTNAATDAALNAASDDIAKGDGADRSLGGARARSAGEQMRSAATERPH